MSCMSGTYADCGLYLYASSTVDNMGCVASAITSSHDHVVYSLHVSQVHILHINRGVPVVAAISVLNIVVKATA